MPCHPTRLRVGASIGLIFSAFTAIIVVTGCAGDAPPRPQLVVIVDTDAPTVGQLTVSPQLAAAAAVDSVRVDIIRDDREVVDFRDFTVPDPRDWPLSFGVVSEAGGKALVRLRVRAFRASLAHRGTLAGSTTVEPPPSLTIDRLVEIPLPSSSVATVRVVLSAVCIGALPSFEPPLSTCIDDARRAGNPADGVETNAAGVSLAGTASFVAETACTSESPAGATCIPGGVGVVGDDQLDGVEESAAGTSPPRPVSIAPFHMDKTEVTVGRYRALLARNLVHGVPTKKTPADSLLKECTWVDAASKNSESFPLNCVSHADAASACAALGGRLPSEAEWEYAARGRGLARRFPWGDGAVECCTASVGRTTIDGVAECSGTGVEPVMAHVDPTSCHGNADVSRDGVFDLGGSVAEATADQGVSLHDPCWTGPGVVQNPVCNDTTLPPGSFARGGDWASGSFFAASAFRRTAKMPSTTVGFRCVYDDAR